MISLRAWTAGSIVVLGGAETDDQIAKRHQRYCDFPKGRLMQSNDWSIALHA